MHKISGSSLVMSLSILTIATLGGWCGSRVFFGAQTGSQFLNCALGCSTFIFFSKLCIYRKAKISLFYQLIFIGFLGIDLAWLFSCLFFPLLLLESVSKVEKIGIAVFYLFVCFGNMRLAVKNFDQKWKKIGCTAVRENLKFGSDVIAWDEIIRSLKLTPIVCIPCVPKNLHDTVTALMFLLLGLGYVFRSINPVLSMVALMIPCSTCAACCLQSSSYRFAEARQVRILEREKNVKFNAV